MTSDAAGPHEPRGARRKDLDAEVRLRRAGSHGYRVRVLDASCEGCKVEFVERPAVGEHVWVRFNGLEAIEGSVRWVEGHTGGVQFLRPLHEAVFERLASASKK
jgi:hypothetical protein